MFRLIAFALLFVFSLAQASPVLPDAVPQPGAKVEEVTDPDPSDILKELETTSIPGVPPSLLHQARSSRQSLEVLVVKAQQKLYLYENGRLTDSWPVSTGVEREVCPPLKDCYQAGTATGSFNITRDEKGDFRMYPLWKSRTWDTNMPHAIFFYKGLALHGTNAFRQLGSRASGGCVRQSNANAKKLYNLVLAYGPENFVVHIRER